MDTCESPGKTGCCCSDETEAAVEETKHEAKSQAMEILRERFAGGEIDNAEFEEKRQVLAGM
jgi:uncharacterized membrane protein